MGIKRHYDIPNLVRELAENRISPLEIIREALSNSKDHQADHVWIKSSKNNRNEVSVMLLDDGEGMDTEQLQAFWGVGSSKKRTAAIGYKGHGTKLYFDCRRLSVATRSSATSEWMLSHLDHPLEASVDEIPFEPLPEDHDLHRELAVAGALDGCGTAIWIERLGSEDRSELLSRSKIESFCDWFTVVGDIRSGLFDRRVDFHRCIQGEHAELSGLALHDSPLRPIEVLLQINGERAYLPMGRGPKSSDKKFLEAWKDDLEEFSSQPGVLAFGHRFANVHEPKRQATRVRDDLSSLRLTGPENWANSAGVSIVARVEGHRRQRETYLEASWQGKSGIYNFQQRFGLWLCRDFIPVTQRNDLLRQALDNATTRSLKFELNSLRNWQVFVNLQLFKPTANRNDIANQATKETEVIDALSTILQDALADKPFRDWVERLQAAALERNKNREISQIQKRLESIQEWISKDNNGIELADVNALPRLDPDFSLRLRVPQSEQELFYIYGLLSGRHQMPVHIVEYDATHGIDAIGILREPSLLNTARAQVRVELKHEVRAGYPIHHFFDAIDIIICWSVDRIGDIYEETSATQGSLRRRKTPTLVSGLDTHEIEYEKDGSARIIPVLQLSSLFGKPRTRKRRS